MKILLINDNHSATGGAENYFFDLKSRLKQHPGIEVYSIGFDTAARSGDDFQIYKAANSNLAKLFWRLVPNILLYTKLTNLIKKIQPDIIHLHNARQYSATTLRVIKNYNTVQTIHDHGLICPFGQNIHIDQQPCAEGLRTACFWQHKIKHGKAAYLLLTLSFYLTRKLTNKAVKAFITVSPGLANIVKKHYAHKAITYIPPFRSQNTVTTVSPQPFHFLFAGNIGRHKGIYMLIKEFALAYKQNKNLYLNIAGSGNEEVEFKKLINEYGVSSRVKLWGWQTSLDRFYADNLALIFPSIGLEGFPLVITEAMTHSRPVIGVNRGTTAWLVEDGQTGLLFDPLKEGDLAEKILRIAGNTELALTLGKNGQQRIHELIDNDTALKKIISVYKEVLKINPRSL